MKTRLFFFTILILFAVESRSQEAYNDTASIKALFNGEIQKQIDAGHFIIYTSNGALPQSASSLKKFAEKISNHDTIGSGRDTIILSKAEHTALIAQLKKYGHYVWPDHLFPNAQCVNPDSAYKSLRILYAKNDSVRKKGIQYFYSFSKPLYIRNNTVALINFAKMCGGDCGTFEFAFYQLRNGQWQFMALVSGGAF